MLRKKIYKISFVLVAVIIAFSLFCLPVSAISVGGAVINVSEASYLRVNGTQHFYHPTISDSGEQVVLRYQVDTDLTNSMDTVTYYSFDSMFNYGTISFDTFSGFASIFLESDEVLNNWNGLYDSTTGEKLAIGQVTDGVYRVSYTGYIPSRFELRVYFKVDDPDSVLQVVIATNFNFVPLSDPNAPQDNDTDKIIYNQNQNADKIINNQNSNHDELKNGWHKENGIDSSTTDKYAAKDKELQEATEQGRSKAVSVFNSFGSLFQSDGHLYKGLLSVSSMFSEFMKIDWLSSLLNFSLAIGIFAFVIGTGSSVFKSAHEKYGYSKERKYMASENSQARREMND